MGKGKLRRTAGKHVINGDCLHDFSSCTGVMDGKMKSVNALSHLKYFCVAALNKSIVRKYSAMSTYSFGWWAVLP